MNKKIQILVLSFAVALALAGLPCVAQNPADQASQAASQAAGAASQAAQQSSSTAADAAASVKVQDRLQKLSSELNLSEDQKAKIKPILQNEVGQAKTVHDDSSLSAADKQAKMQDIHASAQSQMNEILTPDQQKKLAAMKAAKGW